MEIREKTENPVPYLLFNNHYFYSYLQLINGVVRLSHLMVCVNSSVNFVIYYVNGSKFRQAWIQTYGPLFQCFNCCSMNNVQTDDLVYSPELDRGKPMQMIKSSKQKMSNKVRLSCFFVYLKKNSFKQLLHLRI
jgi:hypothetical protein